jgi:GT2 family glycosyltransferase
MRITATDVTVCVVVKDRVALMTECLASIDELESKPAAIIAVDNGSTDGTYELVQGHPGVTAIQDTGTLGGIRNLAVRNARTSHVAFIDSDCVADPSWLDAFVAAWNANDLDNLVCLQGRTQPNPDHDRPWWASSQTIEEFSGRYEACNILYLRSALLQQPFDEQIGYPGEDTAAGWAMERAGLEAEFAPGALVLHAVVDGGLRGQAAKAARYGSLCRLIKLYPEKRSGLVNSVFLTHRTRSAWAALVALLVFADGGWGISSGASKHVIAGSLELLLGVLLLQPWVRRSWPHGAPLRYGLRAIAGRARIDLSMICSLLVGSLRHRCLVL